MGEVLLLVNTDSVVPPGLLGIESASSIKQTRTQQQPTGVGVHVRYNLMLHKLPPLLQDDC